MLFTSLEFLLFLPAGGAVFWVLARPASACHGCCWPA